jgi:tetratricopeptide (TPR) repeat protein
VTQGGESAALRARTLLQLNRPSEARDLALQALAGRPDDADLCALLAHALLDLDRYDEARRTARRALGHQPDNTEAMSVLAAALSGLGELDDAVEVVDRLVEVAPAWSGAHQQRAHILIAADDYGAARYAAERAVGLAPNDANAHAVLGLALFRLRDRDAARAEASEALRLDPENRLGHTLMGFLQLHGGAERDSADRFREALRLDPSDLGARAGMGIAIKARNPVYRMLLRFALWSQDLPTAGRVAVRFSPFIAVRLAEAINSAPITPILYVAAGTFFVVSWAIEPVLNLAMLLSRHDRAYVTADERRSALAFLAFVLGGAAVVTYYLVSRHKVLIPSAFGLVLWAFAAGAAHGHTKRFQTIFYTCALLAGLLAVGNAVSAKSDPHHIATACEALLFVSGLAALFTSFAGRGTRRSEGRYR